MRRLTPPLRRPPTPQQAVDGSSGPSRTERGAVAVMVALLMVPMITVAALAVDFADLYAQRQRLQTGADAAALAIASDCLRGSCGTPATTAQTLATANLGRTGTSTATVTGQTASSVTVKNAASVKHLFAPVIGVSSTSVGVSATATWNAPSSGTAVLPLVVNACEYNLATNGGLPSGTTVRTINIASVSSGCYAAPGIATSVLTGIFAYRPGGFAWVNASTGCTTASTAGGELLLSPGTTVRSTSCTIAYFASLQNQTVLLPVFDEYRQPYFLDQNTVYFSVYGYAAFKITGYFFGSGLGWNTTCSGSQRCLHGYFTRMTDQASGFTYGGGGPQLGAGAVQLTK